MIQPSIIIYSHGFGVRQDDRGLFTDIAKALPDHQHIMFDYNEVDEAAKTMTVAPLDEQAAHLSQVIATTQQQNSDTTIDLICHSQGCIVAALANPSGIQKALFLGAPAQLSIEHMLTLFANRPGSRIDLNGTSRLQRADFSTTNVPVAYWDGIKHLEPIPLYNKLVQTTSLTLINATQDEIIGSRDFSQLVPSIKAINIETNHNFQGAGRQQILSIIEAEL